jgi:hypothetical protein
MGMNETVPFRGTNKKPYEEISNLNAYPHLSYRLRI